MKERFLDVFVHNPMLVEISRFRRRYFSFSTGNPGNSVILTLVLLGYAGFVLIVEENREAMNPISIVMFETAVLTVFAPMMLYGSIAHERERRSWDLLLAAPITKFQIVGGKFMGAMAALSIAVGLFQIPILIAAFGYKDTNWWNLFEATFVSFSFLMTVCALTILFSARVKRGLMALGAVLGILTVALVVFPALTYGAGIDRLSGDPFLYLHPFTVLSHLTMTDEQNKVVSAWGWPQTFVYIFLSLVLLAWAENTLNFAENEVKFLPQGDKNA